PGPQSGSARRPGGGLLAAGVVLVAAGLTALGDQGLGPATRLLRDDGSPRLAASASLAANVDGLALDASSGRPSAPLLTPGSGAMSRYAPAGATLPLTGNATDPATVVERLRAGDPRDLSLSPSTLAAGQGYRLVGAQGVDLGAGLSGRLESYLAPSGTAALAVVWWDWPARAGTAVVRERVIVARAVPSTQDLAISGQQVLTFSRDLIQSMTRPAGTRP
ncbi:MAG TPA: hypothetical protein VET26_03950, partial [Candidatus Sulfotelmatobacter sp.]|nr:hypothetical protein [Candidatus Sulfotelmatobacter sp.]